MVFSSQDGMCKQRGGAMEPAASHRGAGMCLAIHATPNVQCDIQPTTLATREYEREVVLGSSQFRFAFRKSFPRLSKVRIERQCLFKGNNGALVLIE